MKSIRQKNADAFFYRMLYLRNETKVIKGNFHRCFHTPPIFCCLSLGTISHIFGLVVPPFILFIYIALPGRFINTTETYIPSIRIITKHHLIDSLSSRLQSWERSLSEASYLFRCGEDLGLTGTSEDHSQTGENHAGTF